MSTTMETNGKDKKFTNGKSIGHFGRGQEDKKS